MIIYPLHKGNDEQPSPSVTTLTFEVEVCMSFGKSL